MTSKYGPWQIWNGGDCPVAPETKVQVHRACHTREYAENDGNFQAGSAVLEWRWYGRGPDIIAYRVLLEPKRETVVRYASFFRDTKNIGTASGERWPDSNIRLRVPLIDGEPDFSRPIGWELIE